MDIGPDLWNEAGEEEMGQFIWEHGYSWARDDNGSDLADTCRKWKAVNELGMCVGGWKYRTCG